ncbi:hypothetical protein KP509_03G059000 [Ceratopteris richardii]|uniref:CDK5RAP1-like protein n=3 Tax=Ceratopteris richardii TaxID=49495 RepID=A0A8T2V4B7_CERRI|nr:hypothetical protein KP509_03G059000 [Ceratopteris richardii]
MRSIMCMRLFSLGLKSKAALNRLRPRQLDVLSVMVIDQVSFQHFCKLNAGRFCTDTSISESSKSRLPVAGPDLHHFIREALPVRSHAHEASIAQVPYLDGDLTGIVEEGKVYFESYGCQMNVNDLEIVLSIMKDAGYSQIVENADEADVILINTCAIREHAESKVWQRLNYFKHLKNRWKQQTGFESGKPRSAPKVAVLGCMAERLKEKLVEANKMVDVVCGPDAYKDLPRLLATLGQGQTAVNTLLSLEETYADVTPVRISKDSVSAFVSIMRGCNNMCSYCIVPFTRGRERSRPANSILAEVGQLWEQGIKEVMLLGQNVNSYNDISGITLENVEGTFERNTPWCHSSGFSSICRTKEDGLRFSDLLDAVSSRFPEMRFRFTSPHPKDFPDELLHLMAERPNVCKHVHLPAQSGSTRVLERMRRGYTREAYLALVERIRSILPNSSLSSDFIAGFCGETEKDHEETLSLIEMVGYDMAYMFAYSLREKTHAHRKYEDDVPEATKQRRLSEIIQTFRASSVPRFVSQIGSNQLVLVTGKSKRDARDWLGLNEKGNKVIFPTKQLPFVENQFDGSKGTSADIHSEVREPRPGDYVEVQILQTSTASLRAEALSLTNIRSFTSKSSMHFGATCEQVALA